MRSSIAGWVDSMGRAGRAEVYIATAVRGHVGVNGP
jgi:hypothetical protein